jgi:hypothetical protein
MKARSKSKQHTLLAFTAKPAVLTPPNYAAQLVVQPGQVGNLLFDCGQVLGTDPFDLGAGLILLRGQAKQFPHLIEGEPKIPGKQRPAPASLTNGNLGDSPSLGNDGTAAGDAGTSIAHRFRITSHGPKKIELRFGVTPVVPRQSSSEQADTTSSKVTYNTIA